MYEDVSGMDSIYPTYPPRSLIFLERRRGTCSLTTSTDNERQSSDYASEDNQGRSNRIDPDICTDALYLWPAHFKSDFVQPRLLVMISPPLSQPFSSRLSLLSSCQFLIPFVGSALV